MGLKQGEVSYIASIFGKKLEVEEYVLRTVRSRNVGTVFYPFMVQYGYWTLKIKDVTWGKRSAKRGDFGWLKNTPKWCRTKVSMASGRHGSATKSGALRVLATNTRKLIVKYGEDCDYDEEGVTLGQQLKIINRAIKRQK